MGTRLARKFGVRSTRKKNLVLESGGHPLESDRAYPFC